MTTSRLSLACALLTGLFSLAFAELRPVADFVRRPDISGASISEDGRYVSFLTPSAKEYYDLNVYDLQTKESKKFALGGDDVLGYQWIDDHRMIVSTQNRPDYYWRQQVFDVKLSKFTDNISNDGQYFDLVSSLRRDPRYFVARFYDGGTSGALGGLAIINTRLQPRAGTGQNNSRFNVKEWLDIPNGEHHGTLADKEGEVRLVTIYKDKRLQFHYRTGPEAKWVELPFDFQNTEVVGFTTDPDLIYVAHYSTDAKSSRLHRYRVSTGDFGPPLFEDPDYSMTEARLLGSRQPDGSFRVLALGYERDVYVQRAIDPLFAEVQAAVNAKLPGRLNTLVDWDYHLQNFVVGSQSSREPARFLVYNHKDKSLLPLPAPTPWLNPAEMSAMRPIKFPTRDGLKLEGYLSLPAKRADGAKPPLVVYAHGGPWARDTWGYDDTAQLLTSRGYAVFQPNYRGSTGYSKAVSKDNEFDFRKMHDDVTDGVKYLVAQGLVDEKRLAIFGGSFGGYLAVAGAAFEPDLYKCAITFAGVFDWKAMIKQHWASSDDDKFNYDYLMKNLGDPAKQQERFEQNSPIQHVAAIKAAVFVIHGKLDTTVDYRQSTKLLSELEAHKVPHEQLFFDTEIHGFRERKNRQKFLEAVDAFLAKHL